ncbi:MULTISPECIES: mechanosensitive ion channel family protein [Niallia]|jgi:moderate conductance mechanosensitive channel|uniref:Mechanosensitive ion channel protein n=1 Tax=Niallia circulans TaxID=1397 RepID=A0A268FGW7_NIACI|nr:mechanosensitive ion channel family protein [Niallia circulans]AYV65864.1 mechanosensitive ion channel family protein [Niallia circulans]AYV71322.1 mechanosensitive ion channel family protein [Niallia circulans]NRG28991.1 mechanosensitive ion channel family protein [Niallia circulans]PAD84557.1 mechanosensitive ion channel protein [Niallia circulans]QJX61760.1 mechanosensitive ion channel family protein [Niallia circulans]
MIYVDKLKTYIQNIEWGDFLLESSLLALKIILILLSYIFIKKMAKKVINKLFETYIQKHSISRGRAFTLESLTNNLITYVLFFILIITILQLLGIDATAILAGAGIIGLAVGFGAQGLVSDLVSGFFLLLEKQLDVGELVSIGDFSGTVEQVGLRTTQIRGADGTLHFIPNREITQLSNHSRGEMQALVDIEISVHNNIPKTLEILKALCEHIAKENTVITDGPDVVGIQNMGPNTLTIRILAKTINMEQWGVERLIRQEVKIALDENGIKLPETPIIVDKKS